MPTTRDIVAVEPEERPTERQAQLGELQKCNGCNHPVRTTYRLEGDDGMALCGDCLCEWLIGRGAGVAVEE